MPNPKSKLVPAAERQGRYKRGHSAEFVAAAFLVVKGHRILARRFKTGLGEIDLITWKRGRVGFVEVKRRATLEDCEASITPKLRQRVRDASDLWMAKNVNYQNRDVGFDLVFVLPWRVPVWMKDAL
jgi:putative endonuclease